MMEKNLLEFRGPVPPYEGHAECQCYLVSATCVFELYFILYGCENNNHSWWQERGIWVAKPCTQKKTCSGQQQKLPQTPFMWKDHII